MIIFALGFTMPLLKKIKNSKIAFSDDRLRVLIILFIIFVLILFLIFYYFASVCSAIVICYSARAPTCVCVWSFLLAVPLCRRVCAIKPINYLLKKNVVINRFEFLSLFLYFFTSIKIILKNFQLLRKSFNFEISTKLKHLRNFKHLRLLLEKKICFNGINYLGRFQEFLN